MSDQVKESDRAAHLTGYRWPKGKSGNPGRRPKGATITAHLRAAAPQGPSSSAAGALEAEAWRRIRGTGRAGSW